MEAFDTADIDAQIAQLQAFKQARLAKADADARERDREAAKVLVHSTPTKAKSIPSDLPAPPSQPKFTSSASASGPSRPKNAALPALPSSRSSFATTLARRRADYGESRPEPAVPSHDLRLGPGEFGPDPEDADEWRSLEPNSGIRLSKRAMSHAEVQGYLRGRYFLPPTRIYTLARLSRDGATYSLPVDEEWVTIAVVAERSDVRTSGAKESEAADDGDDLDDDSWASSKRDLKGKGKSKDKAPQKRTQRKYISLTLVSLPNPAQRGRPSGDAHFQLLLFEANASYRKGAEPAYRGGSGGAYEKWSSLAVGSVIAIVSPRILRPLKSGAKPHPLTLPFALNPTSATSITIIGHATDLGSCPARKRDGTVCSIWIDARQDDLCEYHKLEELKRVRAGRGEFASATSALEGMYRTENRAGVRRIPQGESDGATYVLGAGKVVHTGQRSAPPPTRLNKRRREDKVAIAASLARLLESKDDNSPGAKYLRAAEAERQGTSGAAKAVTPTTRRHVFSTAAINAIGFDPHHNLNSSAQRSALIAVLKQPVDRTKLVRKHSEPSPEMIDLD
ncbi:hypothetical protein CspHIS471_0313570 [Cutaneotrichosporon sp. HIS471]|nr:hypothetical protein CspHIS471_0313570 [Cutaneotrichosporon sp. HIS471]